jgi:hypothetical protein
MLTFETGEHLRSRLRTFGRAVALGYPLAGSVPMTRKVAHWLASASIAWMENHSFGQLSWQVREGEAPAEPH